MKIYLVCEERYSGYLVLEAKLSEEAAQSVVSMLRQETIDKYTKLCVETYGNTPEDALRSATGLFKDVYFVKEMEVTE